MKRRKIVLGIVCVCVIGLLLTSQLFSAEEPRDRGGDRGGQRGQGGMGGARARRAGGGSQQRPQQFGLRGLMSQWLENLTKAHQEKDLDRIGELIKEMNERIKEMSGQRQMPGRQTAPAGGQMAPARQMAPVAAAADEQVPDKNIKARVDRPAYTDKHPRVLFDDGHFNVHTSQGSYQTLASLLKSDGYEIAATDKPFSSRSLAGHDVLIISNARGAAQRSEKPAFTEQECDAVRDWVKAGGGLLLVVDHYPSGYNAERLTRRFGIETTRGRTTDRANAPQGSGGGGTILFERKNNGLGDHAITRGRSQAERINCVATFSGKSLKGPAGSTPLLIFSDSAIDYFTSEAADNPAGRLARRSQGAGDEPQASAAGKSQGVAFKFGKGRVVVLGEAGHLSARPTNPQQPARGIKYEGCDNRQWAINIAHWLSGLID
ncbi:MAG: DUF4350 domain-containing protein [Planctomycetes bacterium]|nr:DUF4350 domain-containing protein [Planctomycetota bacterium]